MKRLWLKPGRDKSLARRHPWVFSGAIGRIEGAPRAGDTISLAASDGRFLGYAAYSPESQISARVWSWDKDVPVDAALVRARVIAAAARRSMHHARQASRLINAEADGLPGIIADRYADTVVLQVLSAGAEPWRETIADALMEATRTTGCARVYERSDADVRELEGLGPRSGPLRGDEPPARIEIIEAESRFLVDVRRGHKTGFYLDQALNRARIGALARGREVLNCFCYTGGFSIHALANGAARVTSIDSSADALRLAAEQLALNGLDPTRAEWIDDDVFKRLRTLRDQARAFDLVILDPPKLAPTAGYVERAARAYKDINLLALKLLRPGGLLATFSCSGGLSAELFQKIVSGAAQDAGADAELLERFAAAPDHPVLLSFPEGEYLKGLLLRKQ